jgi:hypothetical protein
MRYIGIDQMEDFLDIAIERCANFPETSFFLGDYYTGELPCMDYVIASGALSYHRSESDSICHIITKLFNTCRIAFGFNLLSKVDAPRGILVDYDPQEILKHCKL